MFKKRSKAQNIRQQKVDRSPSPEHQDTTSIVQTSIELRSSKRQTRGVHAEELLLGDSKERAKAKAKQAAEEESRRRAENDVWNVSTGGLMPLKKIGYLNVLQ